jgi:hypothetical protein
MSQRKENTVAKAINVKVKRVNLLKALNKSLENRKQALIDSEKEQKKHKQDVKDWEKKIAELVKTGKVKVTHVDYSDNYYQAPAHVNIRIEVPASAPYPKEPEKQVRQWTAQSEIDEIENAIRILMLCDDEVVSTSTYAGVSKYL